MTQPPPDSDGSGSGLGGDGAERRVGGGGARPVVIGIVVLVLVLVAVLVVAYFGSQAGPSGQPTDAPSSAAPPLELPITVDDLSRDPNEGTSEDDLDTDIETVSATYQRDTEPTLVVIAGRPVAEPAAMLELVQAEAVRPIEDGLCGRDPSGFDVCVVMRENVAVLGLGIASQPIEQILDDTRAVANGMPG